MVEQVAKNGTGRRAQNRGRRDGELLRGARGSRSNWGERNATQCSALRTAKRQVPRIAATARSGVWQRLAPVRSNARGKCVRQSMVVTVRVVRIQAVAEPNHGNRWQVGMWQKCISVKSSTERQPNAAVARIKRGQARIGAAVAVRETQ